MSERQKGTYIISLLFLHTHLYNDAPSLPSVLAGPVRRRWNECTLLLRLVKKGMAKRDGMGGNDEIGEKSNLAFFLAYLLVLLTRRPYFHLVVDLVGLIVDIVEKISLIHHKKNRLYIL